MQITVQNDTLSLKGAITVQTLTVALHKHFVQLCQQPHIHTIDLNGVVRADSACVSLLLTALRQRDSGSLKFIGLPESIKDLAQLYEIESLLNTH